MKASSSSAHVIMVVASFVSFCNYNMCHTTAQSIVI